MHYRADLLPASTHKLFSFLLAEATGTGNWHFKKIKEPKKTGNISAGFLVRS